MTAAIVDVADARGAYKIIYSANVLFRATGCSAAHAIDTAGDHHYPIPAVRTAEQTAAWELIGAEFDRLGFEPRNGMSSAQLLDAEHRDRICDVLTIIAAHLAALVDSPDRAAIREQIAGGGVR